MKTRALAVGCCMMAVLILSGCHSTEPKEVPTNNETKKAAISTDTNKNAASINSTSSNKPAQSQNAKPQGVQNTPGTQAAENADVPIETPAETWAAEVQESTDLGQEADGTASGGEDMQQCPYCGEWYSTVPDGDLWNPYDRHVLEERDSAQGEEQTYEYPDPEETADGEMVQCPDCGNWYEEGNVFRNHVCEGREAEMVQCPDCGNWYEEGNVFRNHICEGR